MIFSRLSVTYGRACGFYIIREREIEAIWNDIDVVDNERKRCKVLFRKQHLSFLARKMTSIDDHYCDKLSLVGTNYKTKYKS